MIFAAGAQFLAALLAAPDAAPQAAPMQFAELTVRRQIIIRTVRRPPQAPDAQPKVDWREQKGPKCVAARAISGASLLGQRSVDLVLRNGLRLRARLGSSCPALDYYYGFYITPGPDGMVCANREAIRSRAGGACEIDRFQLLRAVSKP